MLQNVKQVIQYDWTTKMSRLRHLITLILQTQSVLASSTVTKFVSCCYNVSDAHLNVNVFVPRV